MSWIEWIGEWIKAAGPRVGQRPADNRVRRRRLRSKKNGTVQFIEYDLETDSRLKRLNLRVLADGRILVRMPQRATLKQADRMVIDHADWIEQTRQKYRRESLALQVPPFEPVHGGTMLYRGKCARIVLGAPGNAVTDGDGAQPRILLKLSPGADREQMMAALGCLMKKQARQVIGAIFDDMVKKAGYSPERWQLSGARTRWGVCTSNRTIRYAWRLVFLQDHLIRYVVAHELAHLVELNHSTRFWSEVARLDPQYRAHRRELNHWRIAYLPLN